MMSTLFVRSLEWLADLCYMAGRSRWVKTGLFVGCMVAFGTFIWARAELNTDFTIKPIPAPFTRSDLLNRYVQATGNLLSDGAYDIRVPLLGIFWRNVRFVPMSIPDTGQSLLVLDEGLPQSPDHVTPVTLVGKVLIGQDEYPDYYLKVMNPPNPALFDSLIWVCLIFIAGTLLGVVINSQVRGADYVISVPFDKAGIASEVLKASQPFALWFGSLGAGYGDVVLRQIPITLRAIPAEARLVPVRYPDTWAIMVRQLRTVHKTVVATSYGALPAMRIEFEDERGLVRKGVVAANSPATLAQVLDVLHFVGQ